MTGSTAARRRIWRLICGVTRRFWPTVEDLKLVIGRRVVTAIAGIGEDAFENVADEGFHRRDDLGERVAVVRIAGQRRRDVGNETGRRVSDAALWRRSP